MEEEKTTDVDDLCNRMQNTILHYRMDEIEMDLQKINDLYDTSFDIHNQFRLATDLHTKHVYYHKNIHSSNVEITDAEVYLIDRLQELANGFTNAMEYLERSREFYTWLIAYINENYDN